MAAADDVRQRYLDAVAAAHLAETSARSRPPQLSVSRLGGCTRAAAYALAGTPPSDTPPPIEGRAGNHGTWLHAGLLPRMAEEVGGKPEVDVVVTADGVTIFGRADLAAVYTDLGGELADVKTVAGLDTVRRYGGYADHWVQLFTYLLGEVQRSGQRIRWGVLVYVDRNTGEAEVFVREATDKALLAVIDRIAEINRYAADPDQAPRTTGSLPGDRRWRMRGPGYSYGCDECPWLSRCWPGAVPGVRGAQANIVRTDPARQAALTAYAAASTQASDLVREQEFWRTVLAGAPEGIYGPWRLSWSKNGAIRVTAVKPVNEEVQP